MARTVVYGTNRLTVEDDALTVQEIKDSMSEIFAELKNAEHEVVGNEIHFKVKAGTKGMARTVVYGTNRLTVEDDALTVQEIKDSMSEIFAELKNAEHEVVGNEIHFKVKAGTKGMARTVVYGTNRLTVEDDALTVQEIKDSMSEIFAELKNAEHEVVGSEIHFKVKAGTKGARTVVYGTNRLTVEDDALTVQEIKDSMSEIFAELKNAEHEVVGSEIHFKVKAGTKGARTVVYGTNRLTVEDDALTVQEIKDSMSEIFAELKNAEHEVVGNEIHFKVKAGTKGFIFVLRQNGDVSVYNVKN